MKKSINTFLAERYIGKCYQWNEITEMIVNTKWNLNRQCTAPHVI